MFIPGEIIVILTFPGIIVHEFSHLLFCKIRKIPVLDVCYFNVGDPSGYVIHEKTDNLTSTFLVAIGPFIVNTLLCLLICLPAYMPVSFFDLSHPFNIFLMWLGLSIGMHAIPSDQDAQNVHVEAKAKLKEWNIIAILTFPLIWIIYLFNALSIIGADLVYGAAIGIGIPYLIFN